MRKVVATLASEVSENAAQTTTGTLERWWVELGDHVRAVEDTDEDDT